MSTAKSTILSALVFGLPLAQGLLRSGDLCIDIAPADQEDPDALGIDCMQLIGAPCDSESPTQDFIFHTRSDRIRQNNYQGLTMNNRGAGEEGQCGYAMANGQSACIGRSGSGGAAWLAKCTNNDSRFKFFMDNEGRFTMRRNNDVYCMSFDSDNILRIQGCDPAENEALWEEVTGDAVAATPSTPATPAAGGDDEDEDDQGEDEEMEEMEEMEMMGGNMTKPENMTMAADAMDMGDMEEDMEDMKDEMEADMAGTGDEEEAEVAAEKAGGERALRGKVIDLVNAMK